MPYSAKQKRAIAAKMTQEGKSPQAISSFFRAHGGVTANIKKRKKRRASITSVRG